MDADLAKHCIEQLTRDEGRVKTAYPDHLGWLTIGVGRCVDPRRKGCGLRDSEIDLLLTNDLAEYHTELTQAFPWFARLNPARQGALINMRHQLGMAGLQGFPRMLNALRDEHWHDAEYHALDSKWARVQTPQRARRIAYQLASGEWQ